MPKSTSVMQSPVVKQLPNHLFLEEVRHQLRLGHTATFRVRGFSMRPFLEDRRDRVLLRPPVDVKVGDVALILADDGRYILHRVVEREADGSCLLWGDGNLAGREHCSAANVIGIAAGFYRGKTYYSCSGRVWRWYSAFWMHTPWARRGCLFLYRVLFKLHLIAH